MPGNIREFNRLKQHSSHDLVFKISRNNNTEATLRLLQTFAGVLQKNVRTRVVFKKTHTNYISIERSWNVEFEKNNILFGYFHKATEAGKRQNDWLTLRRIYQVSNSIVDSK